MPQLSSNPLFAGTLYNSNPAPSNYSSTFGGVPGPVGVPNPAQDLSLQLPGLGDLNKTASSDVLSELQGNLSPGTLKLLQDQAAAFGIRSGMPGSGLSVNKGLRDIGLTSEALIRQGIGDYSKLIPTVSGTQTVNPALQAEIAGRNAQVNAAPVPGQAQSYAQSLFDKYLQMMRGPAGGTTGASGTPPLPSATPQLGGGSSGGGDFDAQGNYIGDIPPELLTNSSSTFGSFDTPSSMDFTDLAFG